MVNWKSKYLEMKLKYINYKLIGGASLRIRSQIEKGEEGEPAKRAKTVGLNRSILQPSNQTGVETEAGLQTPEEEGTQLSEKGAEEAAAGEQSEPELKILLREEYDNGKVKKYIAYVEDKENKEDEESHFTIEYNERNEMDMTINVNDNLKGQGIARKLIKELCIYLWEKKIVKLNGYLYIDTDASWNSIKGYLTSFWDYIGMLPNPGYELANSTLPNKYKDWKKFLKKEFPGVYDKVFNDDSKEYEDIQKSLRTLSTLSTNMKEKIEGFGYEKFITFSKLCDFAGIKLLTQGRFYEKEKK